ncbi:PREDICTED: uncharacterized protein LOC104812456 [Tarenaya hassleriana]|uniref:uncharacterized protein LOC104812456 n=1 Tax=Tarenaya hassleriana TaxID=28532 RepID=UPI00053C2272|nr:PREDICTED: uncharacterized protein LOC104812456 [Tarenaya hassleriana]
MRRGIETPSFHGHHRLLLAVGLLVSSSLISFSNGVSCPSHNPPSTLKLQGLRREVLEGGNGTLVLAAERTHRRDPLNNFQYYTGGWNVTDSHYIASVAFSAVPLIAIAIGWFVLIGLFLICACFCCCCCWLGPRAYGYSRVCYALSLTFLLLFTIAATLGCAMLYTGQREFYSSVEETFTYIIRQATGILNTLTGLWDSIQSAKDIHLNGQFMFPPEFRESIDHFSNMIHMSNTTLPDRVSNTTIHYLTGALNPVRLALNVIAGIMLGVALLGLLFSVCGLRVLVYLLVVLGWILVTATILLSAIFLVFHNVVADTCMAMDQWVQNPTAESTLSQLLPCLDRRTVDETLNITRSVTFTTIDLINDYTLNITNQEFPPDFPLYHNLSGPPLPLLCNPFDPSLNPRPCAPAEVPLANASQTYKTYVCQVDSKGICTTQGRLTPVSYDQMMGAINVAFTLDHYSPFLASLIGCTFVRDTFRAISAHHCPRLSVSSQWIYAGLASVSGAVMVSLILWMIFIRERRHRVRTKKSMIEMSRF